jgi:hypothetical protein
MRLSKVVLLFIAVWFMAFTINAQDIEGDSSDKDKPDTIEIIQAFLPATGICDSDFCLNLKPELEAGVVFTGYSDVRIPGDNGTLYSLSKDLEAKLAPSIRARLTKTWAEKHNISLLIAPLRVKSEGKADRDINFGGTIYPAGTELDGYYWFNSYRLTYRYDIVQSFLTDFGIGLTAKIREAGIALESNTQKSKKTNVGFVPIINFRYQRYLSEKCNLLIEGDALAAPQGRAEDIYAGISYKILNKARLKIGYRMLEGGADNDEVYNFAMFHYATIGLIFD